MFVFLASGWTMSANFQRIGTTRFSRIFDNFNGLVAFGSTDVGYSCELIFVNLIFTGAVLDLDQP